MSKKEEKILSCLCNGLSPAETAAKLDLPLREVRRFIADFQKKLQISISQGQLKGKAAR